MTRLDYILNDFATKFATDYPQAGEGEDHSSLTAYEPVNSQNAPLSLKDRLFQRYSGAKHLAGTLPKASTAVNSQNAPGSLKNRFFQRYSGARHLAGTLPTAPAGAEYDRLLKGR